nr:hypothetical protein Iba_chr04aCG16030 [Ipomoea batatas]
MALGFLLFASRLTTTAKLALHPEERRRRGWAFSSNVLLVLLQVTPTTDCRYSSRFSRRRAKGGCRGPLGCNDTTLSRGRRTTGGVANRGERQLPLALQRGDDEARLPAMASSLLFSFIKAMPLADGEVGSMAKGEDGRRRGWASWRTVTAPSHPSGDDAVLQSPVIFRLSVRPSAGVGHQQKIFKQSFSFSSEIPCFTSLIPLKACNVGHPVLPAAAHALDVAGTGNLTWTSSL